MTIDVAKEAARLAALIGEHPVLIKTEAELLEYVGYVVTSGTLGVWGADSALGEIRAGLQQGGWLRALVRSLAEVQAAKRQNQRAGLKRVHDKNIERSRRRGEETRASVVREAARVTRLPRRDQAAIIAKRLELSARHVRRILQTL